MTAPKNPPAFPGSTTGGMTLRDWFAGQALPAVLGASHASYSVEHIATWAYALADAMLAAREAQS